MQIDQIRAFVRCAELGGLSAAARAERMPKSTLSRLLTDLERDLRVKLLDRSSRGVVATQEGRLFLAHARQVLESVEAASASVRPSRAKPAGVVRVTAPYTFAVTFIAPALPAFFDAFPAIDVHLELTSRNVDVLDEGFDLAVRIGTPPPHLVARRLMGNPLRLLASPAYLAAHGAPTRVDDLERRPLLLIGSSRGAAGLRLTRAGGEYVCSAAPKLLSSDPAVVLSATLAGAGIGQIPLIIAGETVRSGALIPVLPEWSQREADISLLYASSRAFTPRVRAFVDFLQANLATSAVPTG